MAIPKGILLTDKWFTIKSYAGNDMDTRTMFNGNTKPNEYNNMGALERSNALISIITNNINDIQASKFVCTRDSCNPPTDGTYFSIIDIFNHLAFRMDFFIAELYALSNCIKNCNLTRGDNATCKIDVASGNELYYCNKQLYLSNVQGQTSIPTNDFKPYMNTSNLTIKFDKLPLYNTSSETTLKIPGSSTNTYKIHPNPYFDLNKQYTYIGNLFNTFMTILQEYGTKNSDNADTIKQKYSDLLALRSKMDAKLEEIFGKNNTMNMQSMQYYDSTIYTSIFWTVLVTTLLFYTFRKL